jgi:16S rRNA (uracil1498-N3)-methyltransferase
MRRLFVPPERLQGATATLDAEAHRHLARVLRARPGDRLTLFDGQGTEVDAQVVTVDRDQTVVALGERRAGRIAAGGAGAEIVLLQSLARGERMDFIVQKTTELGVARIVPVVAGRSVSRPAADDRSAARRARWERIAREAARQSGRADVPHIDDAVPLATALAEAQPSEGHARLALWESSRGHPLRQALASPPHKVTLLIGPEGGFAEAEVAAAAAAGFQIVGLGARILRVETAAIVAVALAQAAAGGLD